MSQLEQKETTGSDEHSDTWSSPDSDRDSGGGGRGRRGRGGPGGGGRGGPGGRRGRGRDDRPVEQSEFLERVIAVNRVAKVVKGGRRFGFNAIVAIGNQKGRVGVGLGKANGVSEAIVKATESARKSMFEVPLKNGSIPHEVIGRYGSGRVLMKPASAGTGVIAGAGVRMILEVAGVHDILTKSLGSTNAHNMVKAAIHGLRSLRMSSDVAQRRGLSVGELYGMRKNDGEET